SMDWENDLRLFTSDVAANSSSAHMDLALAEQLVNQGTRMQPGAERDGVLNRAEQLVDHTLKLAPNFPNAFRVKGMLLELRGDAATAETYYAGALEFTPRDRTAQGRRAALREDAAARAARCDELLKRIEEPPDDIPARLEVSDLLLERGQPLDGLRQLEA